MTMARNSTLHVVVIGRFPWVILVRRVSSFRVRLIAITVRVVSNLKSESTHERSNNCVKHRLPEGRESDIQRSSFPLIVALSTPISDSRLPEYCSLVEGDRLICC